ncbi:MAG: phospholipase D-like domain-containing protein [Bacteroidia bacterium]|nr:phospholipase D-like domain-containing protein [Bacteroidia bacterium]
MQQIIRKIILFLFLSFFMGISAYAQDIRIKQQDLPYVIPMIESPSKGEKIIYRWLENNSVVKGANLIVFTIPKGKEPGVYTYIHQVKHTQYTDWLSSNPFTIEIYTGSSAVTRSANSDFSVIFSPQKGISGYLKKLIELIDNASESLDISIYSIDNYGVYLALKKAVDRGVGIRMLYEGAQQDKDKKGVAISDKLEEIGIDVKYVNKINHHKFIVSDNNRLLTSSGNWNDRANWIYDDNTLITTNNEAILRYRAEFELLWNNSREFGRSLSWARVNPDSLLNLITDNPDIDAVFTSANYRIYNSPVYGPTFAKITGKQDAADKIVALIQAAQHSIKISANHFRSRPIAEALIDKKTQYPNIDIKVFLDQQEYITASYNAYQTAQQQQCLANATTPAQQLNCRERNFYYSYSLMEAGIDVRFKSYSYKWHHTTADLMHHKYAVFDDSVIATGSYNYSYNAETNSMENVMVFNSNISQSAVNNYIGNFNHLWDLGRIEGHYDNLRAYLNSDSRYVPLLYHPVSLTHPEFTQLKSEIESVCPTVLDTYFKKNGQLYTHYLKDVALIYDSTANLATKLQDNRQQAFEINYSYINPDFLATTRFLSSDGITYNTDYIYNTDLHVTKETTPLYEVDFTYNSDNSIATINSGQEAHSWENQTLSGGNTLINYSAPQRSNYISTEWNDFRMPVSLTDADNRIIQWTYNDKNLLNGILSSHRNIGFSYGDSLFTATSSNGENFTVTVNNSGSFSIETTGTVATATNYTLQEQANKQQTLDIVIHSTNVTSGVGKTATVNYLFDAYGKVIRSGNLQIARAPYSGEIISITNGSITEVRSYNDWGLLTTQTVTRDNEPYYSASYLYDGLQRIKQATEIVLGDTVTHNYTYNAAGQLQHVHKNNLPVEEYAYDAFGNRTSAHINGTQYTYQNNNINQLQVLSWQQSGNTRMREFFYNASGQLRQTVNKTVSGNSSQTTASRRYNYDVFGNLDTVAWANQQLHYVYDAYDRPIALYLNGSIKRKLVYGADDLLVGELNENNRIINTFVYADGYTPLLMRKGNTDYYIVADIRGSPRLVIKISDGNVMQRLDYDTFGNVLADTNPGYIPFGYAGGFYEYRTGLTRFGARDYFAETGKWTAEDPIGFLSGGYNDYAYVSNDPVNFVDPTGLVPCGGNSDKDEIKYFKSHKALTRALGPAGYQRSWHHIVNQHKFNTAKFGLEAIHNTANIINLPNSIHNEITKHYARKVNKLPGSPRVRDWLKTKDFQYQHNYGMDVLRNLLNDCGGSR